MDLKNDGHKNKIFCVKTLNEDSNIIVSGGWDRMLKIFDIRTKGPVGSMLGPLICGSDAIDVQGDQILAGSHFGSSQLAIYSLSQRKKIVDIEWEES
jgi:WD40 repeat protein